MNNLRTAVLLVAGTGSRLRPLTDSSPKTLVSLGNETILQRLIRQLEACGIAHFVLATGYCEAMLREMLSASRARIDFCWNPDYAATQNSVSLGYCADAVSNESFIKLDGDLVLDCRIIQRIIDDSNPMSVAIDTSRILDPEAMKVEVDPHGTIVDFGKSMPLPRAHAESVGIEKLDAQSAREVFARIEVLRRSGTVNRYYEDVYADLIRESRIAPHAVDVSGFPWTEVDTFEDLNHARELVQTPEFGLSGE
jgi:choline kinase